MLFNYRIFLENFTLFLLILGQLTFTFNVIKKKKQFNSLMANATCAASMKSDSNVITRKSKD